MHMDETVVVDSLVDSNWDKNLKSTCEYKYNSHRGIVSRTLFTRQDTCTGIYLISVGTERAMIVFSTQ